MQESRRIYQKYHMNIHILKSSLISLWTFHCINDCPLGAENKKIIMPMLIRVVCGFLYNQHLQKHARWGTKQPLLSEDSGDKNFHQSLTLPHHRTAGNTRAFLMAYHLQHTSSTYRLRIIMFCFQKKNTQKQTPKPPNNPARSHFQGLKVHHCKKDMGLFLACNSGV